MAPSPRSWCEAPRFQKLTHKLKLDEPAADNETADPGITPDFQMGVCQSHVSDSALSPRFATSGSRRLESVTVWRAWKVPMKNMSAVRESIVGKFPPLPNANQLVTLVEGALAVCRSVLNLWPTCHAEASTVSSFVHRVRAADEGLNLHFGLLQHHLKRERRAVILQSASQESARRRHPTNLGLYALG